MGLQRWGYVFGHCCYILSSKRHAKMCLVSARNKLAGSLDVGFGGDRRSHVGIDHYGDRN